MNLARPVRRVQRQEPNRELPHESCFASQALVQQEIAKRLTLSKRLAATGFGEHLIFPGGLRDLPLVVGDRKDINSKDWVIRKHVNSRTYDLLLANHQMPHWGVTPPPQDQPGQPYLVRIAKSTRAGQAATAKVVEDASKPWGFRCLRDDHEHCYHVDCVRGFRGLTRFLPAPKEKQAPLPPMEAEPEPPATEPPDEDPSEPTQTTETNPDDDFAMVVRHEYESPLPKVIFHIGSDTAIVENCPYHWFLAFQTKARGPRATESGSSDLLPDPILARAFRLVAFQKEALREQILGAAVRELERLNWEDLPEDRQAAYCDAFRKKLENKQLVKELNKLGCSKWERSKNSDGDGRQRLYRVVP